MKRCPRCGVTRPESDFYLRPNGKPRTPCKICAAPPKRCAGCGATLPQGRRFLRCPRCMGNRDREVQRAYVARHPDRVAERKHRHRQANLERDRARSRRHSQIANVAKSLLRAIRAGREAYGAAGWNVSRVEGKTRVYHTHEPLGRPSVGVVLLNCSVSEEGRTLVFASPTLPAAHLPAVDRVLNWIRKGMVQLEPEENRR